MSIAFAAARRPLARAIAALIGIVVLVTAASWRATAVAAPSSPQGSHFDPTRGGFGVDAAHTSRTGGLASTGFAALTVACIAVALLGAGLIFIAIGRRRA